MANRPIILIVDDNHEYASWLRHLITQYYDKEIDIYICPSVDEARSFLRKHEGIALILSEVWFEGFPESLTDHVQVGLFEEYSNRLPVAVVSFLNDYIGSILDELKRRGFSIFGYLDKGGLDKGDFFRIVIKEIIDRALDLWKEKTRISLFISYSHCDNRFIDRLEQGFRLSQIHCWRDVHHTTSGRLEKQIERAIRENPIVLLVLSENSVKSDWVQHEARLARINEVARGCDILCPITLDDAWKTCRWPDRLREQIMEYNIVDFSGWEDETKFQEVFLRLIAGIHQYYRK
jgi:TIR domain